MRKNVMISIGLCLAICGMWLAARQTVEAQVEKPRLDPADRAPGPNVNEVLPSAVPPPRFGGAGGFGTSGIPGPGMRPGYMPHPQGDPYSQEVDAAIHEYVSNRDETARKTLRGKAIESLGKLFDAQLKQRDEELRQIEAEIAQVREKIQKRTAMREQLLQHRFEGLVQEAEGLGWGSSAIRSELYGPNGFGAGMLGPTGTLGRPVPAPLQKR